MWNPPNPIEKLLISIFPSKLQLKHHIFLLTLHKGHYFTFSQHQKGYSCHASARSTSSTRLFHKTLSLKGEIHEKSKKKMVSRKSCFDIVVSDSRQTSEQNPERGKLSLGILCTLIKVSTILGSITSTRASKLISPTIRSMMIFTPNFL